MRKSTIFVVSVLFLAFLAVPTMLNAQDVPLLRNASFEDGFHEQGASELVIPDYWTLSYKDGDHPWCPAPCHRPEVKPNQEYVLDGDYSVRSFTTFSRGLYAIWQDVDVPPGSWVRVSCNVRIDSEPPGELSAFVGVQPWADDVFGRQMIWGEETLVLREWRTVSVIAPVYGTRARVAFGGNNKWPTRGNTLFWDDCSFEVLSGPISPTPTPAPSQTPEPCPTCPAGGGCSCEDVRAIIREELDNTRLGAVP